MISDILKPKSEKEINDVVNKLSANEILQLAFDKSDKYLLQLALDKGVIINDINTVRLTSELLKIPYEKLKNNLSEKLLLILGLSKRGDPNKMFSAGLEIYSIDLLKKAIKAGATNVNIGNCEALILAVERNDLELFKMLLKNPKIDPSNGGKREQTYSNFDNGALRIACSKGFYEIVKLLLNDKRVNPVTGKNYPLRNAYKNKHWNVVQLLIENDTVFNYDEKLIKKILKELLELIK